MTAINWAELRQNMLSSTNRLACCNASYWDRCASSFNENMAQMDTLTQDQLDRMHLLPQYTVLDVGSGSGRVTLPVAKRVKQVTAVEPSGKMLALLKTNAAAANVTNITYLNSSWEDLKLGADVVPHDVVMASFSLFMVDIEAELLKMHEAATKAVHLFLSASPVMDEELQHIVFGDTIPQSLEDYIYVYNILHDLGILANVEIWNFEVKRHYRSLDEAVSKFTETHSIPNSKQSELRAYLHRNLMEYDGKLWLTRKRKTAMIWWTKTQ